MAPRDKGRQRIEPGFSSDRRSDDDDMRADPEDRPVRSQKRRTASRKPAKSRRGRSSRQQGGGFLGLIRRT
ncbi:hypothetical protein LJD47_30170, partial [Escherichia coli]|nr:hypothetical protein [Escherichia coli]